MNLYRPSTRRRYLAAWSICFAALFGFAAFVGAWGAAVGSYLSGLACLWASESGWVW